MNVADQKLTTPHTVVKSANNPSGNKFVGYLVSIETKNATFYQGVVNAINSSKGIIQLRNCFQNGLHCGSKLVDINTTNIENIEILADPENALSILRPVSLSDITNNSSINENIRPPKQQLQQPPPAAKQTVENRNSLSSTSSNTSNTSGSMAQAVTMRQPVSGNQNKNHLNQKNKQYNRYANNNNSNNQNHDSGHEENCFDFKIDDELLKDEFDFEKNLAMFDKNEFYEKVEGHSRPTVGLFVTGNNASSAALAQNCTIENKAAKQNRKESPVDQMIKKIHNNSAAASLSGPKDSLNSSSEKYHSITVEALFSSASISKQQSELFASSSTANGKNYRYDQMVIPNSEPINFTQIKLPARQPARHYVTDDGLTVPCIDRSLRTQLFAQAERAGLTSSRLVECMGRCVAEMAIQLVGGPIRFQLKNAHQRPAILVLVHRGLLQGAYALCASRLLLLRSCFIYLYVVGDEETQHQQTSDDFKTEFGLFDSQATDSIKSRRIMTIEKLYEIKSIDLILNGLESPDQALAQQITRSRQTWLKQLSRYLEQCKASVISIDPASEGPILSKSKWSIVPVLPMSMSANCGRVYLADLGFTCMMFEKAGVAYKSPFGAKFLIPLHDN